MIIEFCPKGNLRQFLINSRVNTSQEKNNNLTSTLNDHQLLKIAVDVANGMLHLSSHKVFFVTSIEIS